MGGVAVCAMIGIGIEIVRRRNRPTDLMVTPFNPDFPEDHSAQNTGITTGEEMVSLLHQPSPPIVLPTSQRMPPVGLPDKELGQWRRNLRALEDIPTSQQPNNPQESTSSVPRHSSSLTVAETSGAGLSYEPETRRQVRQLIHWHPSEIESLLERLHSEAPPSYDTEGNE